MFDNCSIMALADGLLGDDSRRPALTMLRGDRKVGPDLSCAEQGDTIPYWP